MDDIGGCNHIFYTPGQLWHWLQANRTRSAHKHFKELEIGLLLMQFMGGQSDWSAGFRLKEVHKKVEPHHHYTLDELFAREHLIDDTDADIIIHNAERKALYPTQITRVTGHSSDDNCQERLIKQLSRKILVQPDQKLVLVVSVEVDAKLDLTSIHQFFASNKMPYGRAYLVGKTLPEPHHFSWTQIWPDVVPGTTIDLTLWFD